MTNTKQGTVRFVADLAGNGDIVQITAGDNIYIRVDDGARNTDFATRQTVTVTLRATSGDTAVVTLTETQVNSGIFTGSIPTQEGAAITGDGILQVMPEATVSVEYVDRINASPNVDQIRTDSLLVQSFKPAISLVKSVDQASAKPGTEILYTIYYRNLGVGAALNLIITDSIPLNTTYVPGSIRIGTATSTYATATILTDAVDADVGQVSDGNVLFIITSVAANDNVANSGNDEGKVYFKVRIN